MFKKLILAGVICLSYQALIPQSAFAARHVGTQVTVSGPGGMCRTVVTTFDHRRSAHARYHAGRYWARAARKVVRDYSSTHRLNNRPRPRYRLRRIGSGFQAVAVGQVCFANR